MPVFTTHLGKGVYVVNAKTGADARRVLEKHGIPVTYGAWRDYWTRTLNPLQLKVANVEGGVWRSETPDPRLPSDYIRVKVRS